MKSKASQEYRVLLIGFTVPEDVNDRICHVDRYMPVQTFKFAWSVVRGLENNGVVVDLLSSEPVGVYPSNPQVIFKFSKWDRGNDTWNVIMPFINITGLRHITRFLSCLCLSIWWLIRTRRKKNRMVLIHGVHSAYMYAALVLRKLFRIKIITIVTDSPGVSVAGEGKFTYLLRKIDSGFIIKGLQSMNGLITLTKQLAEHYAPRVPSMVMEGIISEDLVSQPEKAIQKEATDHVESIFSIMYTGALMRKYGIQLLLDTMSLLPNPDYRLWIFGKGDMAEEIALASQKDPRIVYWGFVKNDVLHCQSQLADVLVNPRPPDQHTTPFLFPSKLLEYMITGRPVITTRLQGIPDEYYQYVVHLYAATPNELAKEIRRLKHMSQKERDDIGDRAKAFVYNRTTYHNQGQRIARFLKQIVSTT